MTGIAEKLGINIDFFVMFISWGLIFTRIFTMLILNPFMGGKTIPGRARMAVAIVLSLFIYPLIVPAIQSDFPTNKGIIFALFFKEVFFGFTIGLVTVMVFYALEAAGRVVDHQRGGANAELFVPALGNVSIFGLFNFWLAVAFFLSVGGHRLFIKAFMSSFVTVPLYGFPTLEPGMSPFLELIVRMAGDVLVIAFQLAAPVLIAVFLIDIVLGIANKMAPQINVFELGFAIRGFSGPLMIYISLLILVTQMDVVMQGMIKHVYQINILFGR